MNHGYLILTIGVISTVFFLGLNAQALSNVIITPNSYTAPNGQYPSSYNATTGITSFSSFPVSNSSGNTINNYYSSSSSSKCSFDYIISVNSSGTYAQNCITGNYDYFGQVSNIIVQDALNNGHNFLIKSGIYKFNNYVQIPSNTSIQGEYNTIIQRNYGSNVLIYFPNSNSNLKLTDISIDGNYLNFPNSYSELDFEGKNMKLERINLYNQSNIGIAFEGSGYVKNSIITGTYRSDSSHYCIHSSSTTNAVFDSLSLQGCSLNAIYFGGNSTLSNSFLADNGFGAPGGQIDIVSNQGHIIGNTITKVKLSTLTTAFEGWSGNVIITNNIISGLGWGFSIDPNTTNQYLISDNEFINVNYPFYSPSGTSHFVFTNNIINHAITPITDNSGSVSKLISGNLIS